jgi:hypothetical protein
MTVYVGVPLFGNPGQELEEGSAIRPQQLRQLAAELSDRLNRAAATLERLLAAGWHAQLALHDVLLTHEAVATREQAVQHLRDLGIDPEELMIVEEMEDEEMA